MERSKAKTSLHTTQRYCWIVPVAFYTPGAASYQSAVFQAIGFASIRTGANNNTSGVLQVLQAWSPNGPFVIAQQVATVLDPLSGQHAADTVCPITRMYTRVKFVADATPPGLVSFELGAYLLPLT
jgi:hypothetical protein